MDNEELLKILNNKLMDVAAKTLIAVVAHDKVGSLVGLGYGDAISDVITLIKGDGFVRSTNYPNTISPLTR